MSKNKTNLIFIATAAATFLVSMYCCHIDYLLYLALEISQTFLNGLHFTRQVCHLRLQNFLVRQDFKLIKVVSSTLDLEESDGEPLVDVYSGDIRGVICTATTQPSACVLDYQLDEPAEWLC